ncbi:unnamed protein product, partial [Oncorhynchus mykiss]
MMDHSSITLRLYYLDSLIGVLKCSNHVFYYSCGQNCQYDTAGDRCERCKEGYYGDAAQRSCRVCPCPFSVPANSFAVGCREAAGGFQCVCKQGYAGDRCERCAPGYYGDPLTAGGSCRPCDCNGNGNSCDSRTGVCKNTLEPGDTNTDEQCHECDDCAKTLINDLQRLDEELARIKTQLDSASISASSRDRLGKLENAITETKSLVNKFSSSVNSQKPTVSQLEQDTLSVNEDINALKGKADDRAVDAQRVLEDVGKTHLRAKDLDTEAKNLLKKILGKKKTIPVYSLFLFFNLFVHLGLSLYHIILFCFIVTFIS